MVGDIHFTPSIKSWVPETLFIAAIDRSTQLAPPSEVVAKVPCAPAAIPEFASAKAISPSDLAFVEPVPS